jgi:hypothetical protein
VCFLRSFFSLFCSSLLSGLCGCCCFSVVLSFGPLCVCRRCALRSVCYFSVVCVCVLVLFCFCSPLVFSVPSFVSCVLRLCFVCDLCFVRALKIKLICGPDCISEAILTKGTPTSVSVEPVSWSHDCLKTGDCHRSVPCSATPLLPAPSAATASAAAATTSVMDHQQLLSTSVHYAYSRPCGYDHESVTASFLYFCMLSVPSGGASR